MKKRVQALIFAISMIFVFTFFNTYADPQYSKSISNKGYVLISRNRDVGQFDLRIADMMADLLPPNLDDQNYANRWQQALNDLKAASPNGEITHVQLRTSWKIPDISNQSTWNTPLLGAYDGPDGGQQLMCENWRKWIFGSPAEPKYEPCAAERIRDSGFKLEFCLNTAWTGHGTIPVFHNEPEASYPNFSGEIFLQNYMDDCLRPIAQFLAASPNFQNGDIFMLSFEMSYPVGADFSWNHNQKWIQMIDEVRQIFVDAGKSGVLLTVDHNGWWDDYGLGHDAVALLAPNNPPPADYKGISGATYLAHLDFISVSFWPELLRNEDIPATWDDTYIDSLVVPAWSNCAREYKAGTGHGSVLGQYGRDYLKDFWALSTIMNGTKILLNTGWSNGHGTLYYSASSSPGGSLDNEAQKVAWVAQVRAVGNNSWCAGQDFERYCEDKQSNPTIQGTSWRKSLAEQVIIEEIRSILNIP